MSPSAEESPAVSPALGKRDLRFLLLLSVAQFLAWGSGLYVFAPVIEAVERSLGLSRLQSGIAFSLALLVEGFAGYAVGKWIDAGRERGVMAGGAVVLAAGLALQSYAETPARFILACAFTGLGFAATLYMPAFAVVARRFPGKYRGATMGLTLLGGLSSTAFIPLCALLVEIFDWRTTLLAMALLNLLVTAPLLWHVLQGAEPSEVAAVPARRFQWPPAARLAVFWWAVCFTVLVTTVAAAIPPHIVAMVREAGAPGGWSSALPAVIGIAQSASRLLFLSAARSPSAARWDRLLVWIVPASLMAYLVADSIVMLAVFVVLYGAGNGIVTILRGLLVADYVSTKDIGAVNGLIALPASLGRAAGPWLLGAAWTPHGGYYDGVMLLLVFACAGAFALVRVHSSKPLTT